MAKLIIQGGRRLHGRHRTPGNKNAALPMLAACILTDEPVCLRNIPLIDDVRTMLSILEDLGVSVELSGHTVALCAAGLRKRRLNDKLCGMARSSILFAGPMAARHRRVALSAPGGDVIGRRPLDTHFAGLSRLGIRVEGRDRFSLRSTRLRGARILLEEASVTATENVLMAAVLAEGKTTIFNAACEPHVQDLCLMLRKMGAHISGIGTNYLRIQGVTSLRGVTHTVSPDYVDIASFAAAAAITRGDITIENVSGNCMDVISRPFRKLGIEWRLADSTLRVPAGQRFRIVNDYNSAIPKVEDGPWPSFPSDLMSVAIVLATQAEGTMLFFEKMFESRMYFVDRLIQMGARIVQCDPHRVIVSGRSQLYASHLSSPDIRAGVALLLAALCAKGRSVIDNAQIIDRGYEKLDHELQRLGADVERA